MNKELKIRNIFDKAIMETEIFIEYVNEIQDVKKYKK